MMLIIFTVIKHNKFFFLDLFLLSACVLLLFSITIFFFCGLIMKRKNRFNFLLKLLFITTFIILLAPSIFL